MYNIEEVGEFSRALECFNLCNEQFKEVVADKNQTVWNPDIETLKLTFNAGLIHMLVATDEESNVVGYFCNIINLDPFTSLYKARDVGVFVHPDHRKNGLFKEMLDKMEALLIDRGVKAQQLVFQKGHNETMPLKYGYTPLEIAYEKFLGE